MNPKLQKAISDIERTKAKIAELEALLPDMELKKIDLENSEIIKLVRSVNAAPGEIINFIETYKVSNEPIISTSAHNAAQLNNGE